MTSQSELTSITPAQVQRREDERPARFLPGLPMLILGIVLLLAFVGLVYLTSRQHGAVAIVLGFVDGIVFLIAVGMLRGLTAIVPGQARVIQLFGKYRGTIRDSGLQFVNPFTERIVVSTRIRNQESAQAKVNDADGNPIEIAAVVVWQVRDTANAVYSVDDYVKFVAIQTETAVRHIASSYPYDNRGSGALSLRDNADEITGQLSAEIAERVKSARPCCASSRQVLSWAHVRRSWKAQSAWSSWPWSGWKKKASWNWTRSGRPPWSRICW
jgi:hypothetical protein